jgi:hypothetical protein
MQIGARITTSHERGCSINMKLRLFLWLVLVLGGAFTVPNGNAGIQFGSAFFVGSGTLVTEMNGSLKR